VESGYSPKTAAGLRARGAAVAQAQCGLYSMQGETCIFIYLREIKGAAPVARFAPTTAPPVPAGASRWKADGTMKHIPFVGFPLAEQDALLAALRQVGLAPQRVCASRLEWGDTVAPLENTAFTTVTTPEWSRTYPVDAGLGWIEALQRDLASGRVPELRG
jgi:hypothetical protein